MLMPFELNDREAGREEPAGDQPQPLAVALGVPIGLVSGYLGGIVDEVVMRLVDAVMALPPLVLALAEASSTPPACATGASR